MSDEMRREAEEEARRILDAHSESEFPGHGKLCSVAMAIEKYKREIERIKQHLEPTEGE